jgi:copper resistance protein B
MMIRLIALTVLSLLIMSQAGAEEPVDHSTMDHSKMNHEAAPTVDHSKMKYEMPKTGEHTGHEAMNHDASSMQGGFAPDDARDPHAYSEGYGFGEHLPEHGGDNDNFAALIVDRLESVTTHNNTAMVYDAQAWFGQTYNRVLARGEGKIDKNGLESSRTELLWAHALTPYWDTHLGVRYDDDAGHNRSWFAFGVQGLAPYWLYVEATAYVGEQGRAAFRLELEYDLLITQKLILQPRIEANVYSKRDVARGLGSGLSDFEAGIRLRYEIRREIAPYIGIEWASKFGGTADYQRAMGNNAEETRFVAGIHFWF